MGYDFHDFTLQQRTSGQTFFSGVSSPLDTSSASLSMSDFRQTVVLGPSFMGLGKRPSLQPFHQALLLMGKISNTCGSRKNAQSGFSVVMVNPPIFVECPYYCIK